MLKPGKANLVKGKTFRMWLPDVCTDSVNVAIDQEYHLQGRDGIKFILDHTSHIEKWPEDYEECMTRKKSKCARTKCKGKKGASRNKCLTKALKSKQCKNEAKAECKDNKDFERYVTKITDGADCELSDVCP